MTSHIHHQRQGTPSADYRILLTCGCTVKARFMPMSTGTTYGCTSGLMHGYTLRWTRAWHHESPGIVTINKGTGENAD